MFKKLKEKKELENQFEIHNKSQSFDENCTKNQSFSDQNIDKQELSPNQDLLINNNNENDLINSDSLNEELNKLRNELILLENRNSSLESQLIQYKNDNQFLNNELIAKTEENRQLKVELSEYKSIVIEKDDLLVLNAQLSNQLEQLKQQLEAQHRDKNELITNINTLKESSNYSTNEKTVSVSHLNETIDRLEKSLTDKNKTIKLQQQRLNDIKKTFLQNQSNREENVMEESPKHGIIESNSGMNDGLNEINMTYLRNVIFKYMISSEYEAIHLVKAISVLLKFSKDEEKLIKETIQWKMSWFAPLVAHKPSLLNRK